jgi:hypothetical protein
MRLAEWVWRALYVVYLLLFAGQTLQIVHQAATTKLRVHNKNERESTLFYVISRRMILDIFNRIEQRS